MPPDLTHLHSPGTVEHSCRYNSAIFLFVFDSIIAEVHREAQSFVSDYHYLLNLG
jgi:hypothetical protein